MFNSCSPLMRSPVKIRWKEDLGRPECPYLRRWVIEVFGYAVRLHHWNRSDDKRALHDHPYPFVTVVLKGSYVDVSYPEDFDPVSELAIDTDELKPGSIRYRKAKHTHYVDVQPGGCWTLMFSGRIERKWGFWVKRKDGSWRWKKSNRYFFENGHHQCDQL